jgi:hypothetical protein
MSRILRLLGAAGLLSGYAILAYLCSHPNTSQHYSDYFIKKTTVYWQPSQTNATPEDGIAFDRHALPRFVRAVSGVGRQESWGRWSEHSGGKNITVEYHQPFFGETCLTVTALPSPNQAGKSVQVMLGDSSASFITDSKELRSYSVSLDPKTPVTQLTLTPERPGPVGWDRAKRRTRITGLALKEIKLVNKSCKYMNQGRSGKG